MATSSWRRLLTSIRNGWSAFWSIESNLETTVLEALRLIRQQDQEALRIEIERIVERSLERRLGLSATTTEPPQPRSGGEGQ